MVITEKTLTPGVDTEVIDGIMARILVEVVLNRQVIDEDEDLSLTTSAFILTPSGGSQWNGLEYVISRECWSPELEQIQLKVMWIERAEFDSILSASRMDGV